MRNEISEHGKSLADRVEGALRARFGGYGHQPTEEHWKGLRAIAQTIDDMALGKAKQEFFYSSLPTGMGKTSTLQESIRQMLADPAYDEVGIVVFTHQLEHIPRLIDELQLRPSQFAVRTGTANVKLNAMGSGKDHTNAQVLFATQAKLLAVAKHTQDAEKFWQFRGSPRRVRIWDESILPAAPLVISTKTVDAIAAQMLRLGQQNAADELLGWVGDVQKVPAGSSIAVQFPDWIFKLTRDWAEVAGEDEQTVTVGDMGGKWVRVVHDDYLGVAAIHYHETLPKNLAPMLILDASGALRTTYDKWQAGRGNLTALPSPGKTYKNLTIRHWEQPAGKAAYRVPAKLDVLAGSVLRAFQDVPPGEQLLVIVHIPQKPSQNLETRVRELAAENGMRADLVRFLTWGRHMASNDFGGFRNVMVVGLLQYNWPMNEAVLRASGRMAAERAAKERDIDQLRLGEVAHHLFQAVGRGAVRRTEKGDVPEGCRLWCVFSGLGRMRVPRALLGRVFPEAKVESWDPFGVALRDNRHRTGSREELVAELIEKLADSPEVTFYLRDLSTIPLQTGRRMLADERVREVLAQQGLELAKRQPEKGKVRPVQYTLRRVSTSIVSSNENLKPVEAGVAGCRRSGSDAVNEQELAFQ